MRLVYIAGPFRASSQYIDGQDMFAVQENVMAAMKLGLEVARIPDLFPIIPHANTMFFTASAPDLVWLEGDKEILRRCDAVLMVADWHRSVGATAEHQLAEELEIPIFYDLDQVRTWAETKNDRVCWTDPDTGEEECDIELALSILLRHEVLFANGRQYATVDWVPKPCVEIPSSVPAVSVKDYYDFKPGKLQSETVVLFVLCNDVFDWATSDAEPLPLREVPALYRMWKEDPAWGAVKWACVHRNRRPQKPIEEAMKKVGAWNGTLDALQR